MKLVNVFNQLSDWYELERSHPLTLQNIKLTLKETSPTRVSYNNRIISQTSKQSCSKLYKLDYYWILLFCMEVEVADERWCVCGLAQITGAGSDEEQEGGWQSVWRRLPSTLTKTHLPPPSPGDKTGKWTVSRQSSPLTLLSAQASIVCSNKIVSLYLPTSSMYRIYRIFIGEHCCREVMSPLLILQSLKS